LRLLCAVGLFLLHKSFDRIRAELRCGFFENGQKIVFKTGPPMSLRRFASLYEVLCMVHVAFRLALMFSKALFYILGNLHIISVGSVGI